MKKWMFTLVVAVAMVGSPVFAETAPQGDHSPKKQSTPIYPYQAPNQSKVSSSAKLFQMVSACLVDRGARSRRAESVLER